MKKILFATMLILLTSSSIFGQRDSKDRMEAKRVAYITNALDLTVEESQNFWPVFNAMNSEIQNLKKENNKKKDLKNMTEEEASLMMDKSIELEIKVIDLKKKYLGQLKDAIGAKKLVRLRNVERNFKENMLRSYRDRYVDKIGRKGRKK